MMAAWPQAPALEKDSPFKEKGKAFCAWICACFVMGHITMNPKEEGKRGGGAFAFLVGTAFELTLFPLGKGTKITEEGGCVGGE